MPDDLWTQVQTAAKVLGLTAGEFVRLAVEERLGVPELDTATEKHTWNEQQVKQAHRVLAKIPVNPAVTTTSTAQMGFECPVCRRRFQSAVRCPCSNRLATRA